MAKEYFMCGIADERVQASENLDIKFVSQMSNELFNEAETKITRLSRLSREESLYTIVKMNYRDIKNLIDFTLNNLENLKTNYELLDLFNNINRLVLNFLASVRTFIDHTERQLKHEYGSESEEYKSFKKLTGELFDEKFSYRFLEQLRNYAQHCGLPAGEVFIDSVHRPETEDVLHTVNLNVLRDNLLLDYDWHKEVKKDLPQQPERFDLIPLITEKFLDLEKINNTINRARYPHFEEDAKFLLELMKESSKKGGFPCLVEVEELTDAGGKIAPLYFPYREMEKILNINIEFNPFTEG